MAGLPILSIITYLPLLGALILLFMGGKDEAADHRARQIAVIVSGAELVSVEPLGSDTYQTTLRLPARQVAQLRQRLQR